MEAAILHQMIRHQALLHLGQTGTRAAGTPPQETCQGSAAGASDQSSKLSRSLLDWLESPGVVIYLQDRIDRLVF